jgi:hypothetical protein
MKINLKIILKASSLALIAINIIMVAEMLQSRANIYMAPLLVGLDAAIIFSIAYLWSLNSYTEEAT